MFLARPTRRRGRRASTLTLAHPAGMSTGCLPRFRPRAGGTIDADTTVCPASGEAALPGRGGGLRGGRLPSSPTTATRRGARNAFFARSGRPATTAERGQSHGVLPVQQRRDRRASCPQGPWGGAGGRDRLRRPPRQRDAGHLLGRRRTALCFDPPGPVLSRHRRGGGAGRARADRQRALAPPAAGGPEFREAFQTVLLAGAGGFPARPRDGFRPGSTRTMPIRWRSFSSTRTISSGRRASLCTLAAEHAGGRLVSTLEGGLRPGGPGGLAPRRMFGS